MPTLPVLVIRNLSKGVMLPEGLVERDKYDGALDGVNCPSATISILAPSTKVLKASAVPCPLILPRVSPPSACPPPSLTLNTAIGPGLNPEALLCSTINTFCGTNTSVVFTMFKLVSGEVVPMPTLPALVILIASARAFKDVPDAPVVPV